MGPGFIGLLFFFKKQFLIFFILVVFNVLWVVYTPKGISTWVKNISKKLILNGRKIYLEDSIRKEKDSNERLYLRLKLRNIEEELGGVANPENGK